MRGWNGRRTRWATIAALTGLLTLMGCGSGSTSTAQPARPVLARPSQLTAYSIFVTDLATGDVNQLGVATYHLSLSVHGLGLSPDGHTVYISDISDDELIAMTFTNGKLTHERTVRVGDQPVHMAQTPDGKLIFVTDFASKAVSVVDATTWTHVKDIAVPANPHAIVLSPDGRWAYVSCFGGAAIAVIDTQAQTLAATIAMPSPSQPYGIAISPDGRYLYASDNLLGRLLVVDTASRRYLRSVPIGVKPALIARSPDGKTLYVTNGASHTVSVVDIGADAAQPTMRANITVDGYPHGIAVTPDGRYVVVAGTSGRSLSVIDAQTNTVIATIPAENDPNDVLIPA
ncbi:MAG: hypothetical protein OJF49_004025 [Ktedonobacterales bacterium]|nr:MAG: hypothetical protein OJF49_004025 [Ktedonobacterales bacterium]